MTDTAPSTQVPLSKTLLSLAETTLDIEYLSVESPGSTPTVSLPALTLLYHMLADPGPTFPARISSLPGNVLIRLAAMPDRDIEAHAPANAIAAFMRAYHILAAEYAFLISRPVTGPPFKIDAAAVARAADNTTRALATAAAQGFCFGEAGTSDADTTPHDFDAHAARLITLGLPSLTTEDVIDALVFALTQSEECRASARVAIALIREGPFLNVPTDRHRSVRVFREVRHALRAEAIVMAPLTPTTFECMPALHQATDLVALLREGNPAISSFDTVTGVELFNPDSTGTTAPRFDLLGQEMALMRIPEMPTSAIAETLTAMHANFLDIRAAAESKPCLIPDLDRSPPPLPEPDNTGRRRPRHSRLHLVP